MISAEGVRRKVLARFPYSLLYLEGPDRIRIVAVMTLFPDHVHQVPARNH